MLVVAVLCIIVYIAIGVAGGRHILALARGQPESQSRYSNSAKAPAVGVKGASATAGVAAQQSGDVQIQTHNNDGDTTASATTAKKNNNMYKRSEKLFPSLKDQNARKIKKDAQVVLFFLCIGFISMIISTTLAIRYIVKYY
jgi:hypothetical protein